MPGCLELAPKMTGSTSSGPPQPPKDAVLKAQHHHLRVKMTPRPQSGQPGQPIQLTPLWEHVVRTRRFPKSVDAESTFREISERLRDPEWEVRQHALRVLVDVLPVLEQNDVDKLMVSVVPELVTNLGHPAPAVRKGALDTLRVYLCYSQDKENMFKKILDEGFNRPDALDNFQSNVSMGVILSVPSLLFPSAGSPRPPEGVLKYAVNSLASRLVQVTHQEAALRSLARIREILGAGEFDLRMMDYNSKVKRDFEVLCEVYNVGILPEKVGQSNGETQCDEVKEIVPLIKEWSSDSDSSGGAEDEDHDEDQDDVLVGPMPPARVVLETEIKFDEETAITMTILEEKDKESDAEETESSSDYDAEDAGVLQVLPDAVPERRKTRRRVRFGGEIVKLRTPDSDEVSLDRPEIPRTKIPLPLFPATKMPRAHQRSSSQPTSPTYSKHPKRRSLSSSPKREIYMHNALLSPKKSILTRPSSPVYVIEPTKSRRAKRRNSKSSKTSGISNGAPKNPSKLMKIKETTEAVDTTTKSSENTESGGKVTIKGNEAGLVLPDGDKLEKGVPEDVKLNQSESNVSEKPHDGGGSSRRTPEKLHTPRESPKRLSRPSSHVNFDVFPKQERNYILMELSSPERRNKQVDGRKSSASGASNDFLAVNSVQDNDASFSANISTAKADQLLNQVIDKVSTTSSQTSGTSQAIMTQRFPATMNIEGSSSAGAESYPRNFDNSTTSLETRNQQSTRNVEDQTKGDPKVTIIVGDQRESENGARLVIPVDKSRGFRELLAVSDGKDGPVPDENESLTCSSSEGEGRSQEPSWEELGLVDQDTLNDLHNKDDWRIRVRGLERLASALKTSSALMAVEPRLGSLLQAVLGGERSCRIAAAGMAVARVAISGVSEDALRRRLPQLAWGLTRQGGPHAAQLARIAMLRLRPALLLEQLLQPHCLGARNGKTRENALQLLIFSLVTFPSTEFKVQTVARRVAETVGDRRRRVRQAALDALAVLGQIYETEEVLEAGERAASGRHDGEAMKAAIRSRLARKSLPLVSADGLVVYGLQISPAIRIATGADVDWIVAGSGSLSPGSGRSRGQLIGVSARLDSASIFRSESARSNPWAERPDLIAVGIGVGPREYQQPFAWQLVPVQNQLQDDGCTKESTSWTSESRNVSTGITNGNSSEDRIRLKEKLLKYYSPSLSECYNSIKRDTRSNGEISSLENYPRIANEYLRKRFYEYCKEKARVRSNPPPQEGANTKVESRIPVLHGRDRVPASMKEVSSENPGRRGGGVGEALKNGITTNEIPRGFNRLESRDTNIGYASMYQRRRRLVERNAFQALQAPPELPNHFSFPGQRYGINGTSRKFPEPVDREARITRGRIDLARTTPQCRESTLPRMNQTVANGGNRSLSHSSERRNRSKSRSQERHNEPQSKTNPSTQKTSATQETYASMYQRRRRLIEGNAFLALQASLNETEYHPQQTHYSQHSSGRTTPPRVNERSTSRADGIRESVAKLPERNQGMTEIPTVDLDNVNASRSESLQTLDVRLRRPRSRSQDNRIRRNTDPKVGAYTPQSPARYNADKAVADEENYELQRRASSRSSVYEIQSASSRNSQYQVNKPVQNTVAYEDDDIRRSLSADSSSSNISVAESHHTEIRRLNDEHLQHCQDENQSSNSPASHNSRSSTPRSQGVAAFDVIPFQSATKRRSSVSSYVISTNSQRSIPPEESIAVVITDEDTSSTDPDVDEQTDEQSIQDKLSHDYENQNAEYDTDDTFDAKLTRTRDSGHVPLSPAQSEYSRRFSKKPSDSPRSMHSFQQLVEEEPNTPSKLSSDSRESEDTVLSNHIVERNLPNYGLAVPDSLSGLNDSPKSSQSFGESSPAFVEDDGEAAPNSSAVPADDTRSLQSLRSRSFQELDRPELYSANNSATMVRSSQGHSTEHIPLEDNANDDDALHSNQKIVSPELSIPKSSSNTSPANELAASKSSLSENSQGPNVLDPANGAAIKNGLQSLPGESIEPAKPQPSRVPRMKPKARVNSIRSNPPVTQNNSKSSEKPTASVQLCFTQLESKDWEVITKGLKTLSQIVRQNPVQLEVCAPGTLGRVLGRHVRNLRSQVSRAACLAAGEVFHSQIKGIEQEIDDIAGPLLHRTADTNKFLRADSNAALDRLVESISPHKMIAVIIHRGATHQNAIVRATAARLLSDVINRIGPDQTMTLPREVRDKILATGAKLLIDGNLDARNYAKKMFRGLSHCEGFLKALTDAVPETTLRHIDKTLRSL